MESNSLDKPLREGHYARKQIFSKSWLISWSHRGRFEVGLQLASQFAGKRVLDYGCGDGSFLAMLMNGPAQPAMAVGAELQPEVVEDCRSRLGTKAGLSFVVNEELETAEHQGVYDAVICMEVMEHVLEPKALLDQFARLLSPSGKLLISVPVETGLPLLVKEAVRRFAGWRGIGDYPGTTSYTVREFATSVFASGKRQHIVRPVHLNPDGSGSHDHKGFNWMVLRNMLAEMFEIERVVGSPLDWLTPHLGSQVWFLARKKA
jgi:SAM-dependent methyltransferase